MLFLTGADHGYCEKEKRTRQNNAVQFFKTYEELEKAFTHYWPVTPWEEHSDNALEEILGQIENGFDEIPLGCFENGEDL